VIVVAASLCMASGFAVLRLGWPGNSRFVAELLLKASLSIGFGLGIFSIIFFLSLVFHVSHLMLLDFAVFAVLLAANLVFSKRSTVHAAVIASESSRDALAPWVSRLIGGGFIFALVAALYSAILRLIAYPHGDGWDAFAIWNLRARFLFRGGEHWRDGFTTLLPGSHPDYPLLLPAAIAHFWRLLGSDSPMVPAVLGFLFTFCTVALLFSGLSTLRGRTAALLGGIALLTTPFFVELGTSQYADVPLGFFFLATIVLLNLHDDRDDKSTNTGLLALAGLSAIFAAWTKNEGLLFLVVVVLARVWVIVKKERPYGGISQIVPLLGAIAPIFLVIFYFKHSVATGSDIFASSNAIPHKLMDPGRYGAVLKWYGKGFLRFGNWFLIPGTVAMLVYYFVSEKETNRKSESGSGVAIFILTLVGYFAIYLITPYDIYWHLRFSLTRLFMQLWPSALFLFFRMVRLDPEQVAEEL